MFQVHRCSREKIGNANLPPCALPHAVAGYHVYKWDSLLILKFVNVASVASYAADNDMCQAMSCDSCHRKTLIIAIGVLWLANVSGFISNQSLWQLRVQ